MIAILAAALAGCGGDGSSGPPEQVEGEIISLQYEAGALRSFTVRDLTGEIYELYIVRDVNYGFDLNHLREHRSTRDPVRCSVEERSGSLVALTIEDA